MIAVPPGTRRRVCPPQPTTSPTRRGPPPIRIRPFRNDDPPQLAALWNRSLPAAGAARPLSAHEFDAVVVKTESIDTNTGIIDELQRAVSLCGNKEQYGY